MTPSLPRTLVTPCINTGTCTHILTHTSKAFLTILVLPTVAAAAGKKRQPPAGLTAVEEQQLHVALVVAAQAVGMMPGGLQDSPVKQQQQLQQQGQGQGQGTVGGEPTGFLANIIAQGRGRQCFCVSVCVCVFHLPSLTALGHPDGHCFRLQLPRKFRSEATYI